MEKWCTQKWKNDKSKLFRKTKKHKIAGSRYNEKEHISIFFGMCLAAILVFACISVASATNYMPQDCYSFTIETSLFPPVSDPNGPYAGREGVPILFNGSGSYDTDGSIVAYEWTFGDGNTATGVAPTHTYAKNGTYTVALTVTDNDGATDTNTTTATIADTKPTADFSATPTSGPEPLTVAFSDNSTSYDGIEARNWDFDNDGVTDSTVQNPTHVFAEDDVYTVSLTVTESDGDSDTMTKADYITVTKVNNQPYTPANPSPSDGAADVSEDADLSWTGGDLDAEDAVTYDVYFGTSTTPPLVSENQAGTSYDPGTLDHSTEYYWQIVATDDHGAYNESGVWTFTTTTSPGTDLVDLWHLDEGTGVIAMDSSGNGNDGTLVNDPMWVDGKLGKALSFDGVADYVDCGHDASLDITDEITIMVWVKPNVAGEGGPNAGPVCKAEAGVDWSWQLRYNAPDGGSYMGFQFNGVPEGSTWVSVKQDLSPGDWYHIAGTFDGTTITCYLNGIEKDTNQISAITSGNSTFFIGQDGWNNIFNGIVDEVKIYNWALGAEEIRADYEAGSSNHPPTAIIDSITPEPSEQGKDTISFSGHGTDTDGTVAAYNWRSSMDGQLSTASSFSKPASELSAGSHTIYFKVEDDEGAWSMEVTEDLTIIEPANPAPVADPSGPYTGTEGVPIAYDGSGSYDTDGFIVAYEWEFGDGTTATGVNPTHTYAQNGTYTVTLTVTDNDGATNTSITTAMVADTEPVADFSAMPTSGLSPLTVAFTDASTSHDGIEAWSWDFDSDGETDSTVQNPTHVYAEEGIYTVSLTVTESDGDSDTMTKTDYIIVTEVNQMDYLWLEAEDADMITPDFEIASNTSASNGKYIQIPEGVGWRAHDGEATYTISIGSLDDYVIWGKVLAATEGDNSFFVQIEDGTRYLWTLALSDNWQWDAVNHWGSGGEFDPEIDPVVFTLSAGEHTLRILQREDGAKLDKLLITNDMLYVPALNNPPTAFIDSITPDPAEQGKDTVAFTGHGTDTDGSIVAYHWSSGIDGLLSTASSFSKPASELSVGMHTIYFKVQDDEGAWSTEVMEDLIIIEPANQPPVADPSGPYTGTEGVAIDYDGSGSYDPDGSIVAYEWDFGDGGTATGVTPTHTYAQDGAYNVTLTVTDNDGATNMNTTTAAIADIEPIVDFSATPTSGQEPLTVTFTDNSTSHDGIEAWAWDFDNDGVTDSTVQNPTHVYAEDGVYTVSLKVYESEGDSDTMTKANYITVTEVNNPPVADPNGPYTGMEGDSIPFNGSGSYDPDGSIVAYEWDFGDGNTSPEVTPTYTYAQDGTYTVTLTVTDNDGATNMGTTTATIADTEPTADFSATPTHGQEPLTVAFSDNSASHDGIATWEWDFNSDGETDSTEQNPTYEYAEEGVYTVSLKITESDGDSDTMTKTDYIIVTEVSQMDYLWLEAEDAGMITPDFEIASDTSASNGKYIQIPEGVGWRAHDGEATYTISINSLDDYVIWGSKIAATEGDNSFFVQIDDGTKYLWTLALSDNWQWDAVNHWGSGGEFDPEIDPVVFTLSAGEHTLRILQREDGAKLNKLLITNDMSYVPASNQPPTAIIDSITPDPAEQGKDTIAFTGHGTDTDGTVVAYHWSSSIDGLLSTASSFSKPASELSIGSHTIYFKVEDDKGAWSTEVTEDLIIIEPANQAPVSDPSGQYTGTEGVPIAYDGSDSYDTDGSIVAYEWDFGDGGTATGVTPTHIYAQNGTYSVSLTVTDNDGATDTNTTTATIADTEPAAEFSAMPTSGLSPLTVAFTDASTSHDGIMAWEWDFDNDGETDSTEQNPTQVYGEEGIYTVSLKVYESDGDSDTMTKADYTTVTKANQPPISDPNGPYTGTEGVPIAYDGSGSYDPDGSIVAYEWVFGDGTTSPEVTPTYTYAQDGTYTVTLTVTDNEGATNTSTTTATIVDTEPAANFSATPTSGQEPLTVAFTDASTSHDGIEAWNWDFDSDGETDSTAQNPAHVYAEDGVYTLSLTVTESDGDSDTMTKTDYITVAEMNQIEYIWLEAEDADILTPDFELASDTSASNGEYIQIPEGVGWRAHDGEATYNISIITSGNYVIWGSKIAATGGDNSFFVQIDDGTRYLWTLALSDNWQWDAVNHWGSGGEFNPEIDPVVFTLSAGEHTLRIIQREDGAKLDELLITNDMSYVPVSNQPPTAIIDSITPDPAEQGKDTVSFSGHGTDTDGTVVAYNWSSSVDGLLSTASSFSKPASELSVGSHTIYFKVQDDEGAWSTEVTKDLTIIEPANQAPVADPSGPYTGTEGVAIAFDGSTSLDPDGSIVAYEWDFGDGNTETGVAPTHTHAQDGFFTVTLTVTDNDGATNTSTTAATIADTEPVADFSAMPTSGLSPLTVAFTDNSTSYDGIEAWSWDFDSDGETDSTVQNPTHVYAEEGIYTVSLTVTESDGGSDTMTKTDYITVTKANQPPISDPNGPYTGTEGVAIAFDGSTSLDPDGSIVAYEWDFGDGTPATGVAPTHTYAQNGTYTVTLTVTDNEGATNTSTTTATIADIEPTADFSATPTSGLSPLTVAFTDASASHDGIEAWNWDFDSDGETDSTEQNPTHVYAEEGMYTVSLTVNESDGDSNTMTKADYITVIKVNAPPVSNPAGPYTGTEAIPMDYDGSGSYDYDGSIVAYEWDFGDGNIATDVTPTHTYAQDGDYTISLTVTDNEGATDTNTTTTTIADTEPTAEFYATPTSGEEPLTVAFTDNSASYDGIETWNWDFDSDSVTDSTEQNPTHVYAEEGVYTVSLTITESDEDSDTMTKVDYITVTRVNAPPEADPNGPYTGTEGVAIAYDGSGSYDPDGSIAAYRWDFGDGNTATGVTPTHTYAQSGTYTVALTVTDNDDGTNTSTTTTTIADIEPTADFSASPTSGEEPLTVTFTDNSASHDGIVTWDWDFDNDGETDSTEHNPTHVYAEDGIYTVSLTVTESDEDRDTMTKDGYITVTKVNEPPVADPRGPYTGTEGVAIVYDGSGSYDPDGSIGTYEWDFGDETTGTGVAPTHTYAQDGTYTVALTVTDNDGATNTSTTTATIADTEPTAAFSAARTHGRKPLTVAFTDKSASYDGLEAWAWDFDNDGVADSTEQNPTHVYIRHGIYTVSLTVTESDGDSGTMTKADYITVIKWKDSNTRRSAPVSPSGGATDVPVDED